MNKVENKNKSFTKTKGFFSKFFGIDIPDENSGLDAFINGGSEEEQEIASILKDSLNSIDSGNFEKTNNKKSPIVSVVPEKSENGKAKNGKPENEKSDDGADLTR